MEHHSHILVLTGGAKDATSIRRLKTGWKLKFACDPVLSSSKVRLFWNHSEAKLHRGNYDRQYEELKWRSNDALFEGYDVTSEEKTIHSAGVYEYYYTINGSASKEDCDGFGYFIVDPDLTVGKDDTSLSMDAIQLQTVLPKLLGPFPQWRERLSVSHRAGYNMIHFAPLQSLNEDSRSSYSIKDQLKLNPAFSTSVFQCTHADIGGLVKFMKEEWNVLSITDMVYNHTASDSDWLTDHPESSYNLLNSPHLKPAYLLDRLVWYTSLKVAANKLADVGIPARLISQEHLENLRNYLKKEVGQLRLHEFFTVDVAATVAPFTSALHEAVGGINLSLTPHLSQFNMSSTAELVIEQDPQYERLCSSIDVKEALLFYTEDLLEIAVKPGAVVVAALVSNFEQRLIQLNEEKMAEVQRHVDAAINNIIHGARYRFLDEHGERYEQVSAHHPLVHPYFVNKKRGYIPFSMAEDISNMESPEFAKYIMACNGWVMGDDPLKNFAQAGSKVYLRRELIVWGDCVKLRYGESPDDSAYLWQRMEEYTKQTVEIFHGIRLDNCHSTPLHVAEHMVKYARSIRPNLYVMAELFTSNENTDNIFVNRLGLNSLTREALVANGSSELGAMVHRFGGRPVGSFVQPTVQILNPTVAHALFMDATHDNESIIAKRYNRTINDSLPLAAAVAMSCCAIGSNRGFDEFVPHHIHVVEETRLYPSWSDDVTHSAGYSSTDTGIISAKAVLNSLHRHMGDAGYSQIYVHDLSADVLSITRHNPNTHASFIGVMRSASNLNASANPDCDRLTFEGRIGEVKLYGRIKELEGPIQHSRHEKYVNGLISHVTELQTDVSIGEISGLEWSQSSPHAQTISFKNFPPGSVLVFSVLPNTGLTNALTEIFQYVSTMNKYEPKEGLVQSQSDEVGNIEHMMSKLTLSDLNAVLYHCDAEERSINGYGSYYIPEYGSLVYTGLQGIFSVMTRIRSRNDLGHPLCQNIRHGDWLFEYIVNRLASYPALQQLSEFISAILKHVKLLPRYLIPCYFDIVMTSLSMVLYQTVWNKLGPFIRSGSPLVKELALSSLQFCGRIETAKLARLSPSLEVKYKHPVTGEYDLVSISAGLPHFSEGLMRIWGRDTFIALRGLMLVTGRFLEAKAIILSFAATLRHGLIPNLHGEGIHARYNCRDAVWWWLQAIQDYCTLVPQGHSILKDEVLRVYHMDDNKPYAAGQLTQALAEVMQESLQRHADGIKFRERNAGCDIDEHMTDAGFNVEARIDWDTGFVTGGNAHNCGTWMDKMGSSAKAGNKGKPATPRDGSAVELVGLCASVVKWLANISKRGLYPYEGVAVKKPDWKHSQLVTFNVWHNLIKKNFEKAFFVDGTYTSIEPEPHSDLINKRNIYKDSMGASSIWADYQLRPNFSIAMAVAPDLFTTENAIAALDVAETHLIGPLGMRTLDRSDWNYDGDYINGDDSTNHKTAYGFNYHNGPEWLWPLGYYMRATLIMAERLESQKPGTLAKTIQIIENRLSVHHLALLATDWRSLPELTNSDGKPCADSCPSQAWSISCLMDVLYDINRLRTKVSS